MADDINQTRLIAELLQQTTSIPVVSAFLKEKGLASSAGSWDDMREKRLVPAVSENHLTNADLIGLLRDAEENGRQHVFLYAIDSDLVDGILDARNIQSALKTMKLEHLWENPIVLDQPENPTIADVRVEGVGRGRTLVVKEIEQRVHYRPDGVEKDGDTLKKVYRIQRERVVNVARLHATGLLELRFGSHSNTSKYVDDIRRFRLQIATLIPTKECFEMSLSNAKSKILQNRRDLGDLIRYSNSTLRNENGVVLHAATGAEGSDLNSDKGAQDSIDAFIAEEGECEGLNFFFKAQPPKVPKDVHVLLSGELNEFAIPANCTAEDYDYVLDQIRRLNK